MAPGLASMVLEHWLDLPRNGLGVVSSRIFHGVGRGAGATATVGLELGTGRPDSKHHTSLLYSPPGAPDDVGVRVRVWMGHGHYEQNIKSQWPPRDLEAAGSLRLLLSEDTVSTRLSKFTAGVRAFSGDQAITVG